MSSQTPTDDAYPLRVGDRVFDRYQISEFDRYQISEGDPELAIVLSVSDESVYEATFSRGGEEIALADLERNRRYGDFEVSDRVVSIAFASWLSAYFDGWTDYASDPEGLVDFLSECESEWSIPYSEELYDYPESRLQLAYRP